MSRDRSRPRHDTILAALESAARDRAPLFTFHGKTREPMDCTAVLEGAARHGRALRTLGVEAGDRVAVLLPTSPGFVRSLVGTMLAAAVPVPLAVPLTFGSIDRWIETLRAILEDAGARVVITTDAVRDALARNETLRGSLGAVLTPAELDLLGQAGVARKWPSVDATTTALLQYTSGTTGRPKGAVITHRALTSNAHAIARGLAITERDVGVSWLPLFHDMGLVGVVLTGICHPYPIHLLRPECFAMRPARWLSAIAETGATLSAAPNFAYELCVSRVGSLEGARLDRWRVALNGAEPVQSSTVERFRERFRSSGFRDSALLPVYGMAESTLAVTFPDLEAPWTVTRGVVGCGRPVAGTAVRVCDDRGAIVDEGVVGEIEVTGPSLMAGYYRNETKTAEVIRDGWLRTGDLGLVRGGELFVTGRRKEVIIKGGRNVHPHDVERVTAQIEGVSGVVAAFARPNATTGTDDLVVVAEARAPDREKLARAVTGEVLAALGVKPDLVCFWPIGSIPRTTSGKVRRGACRALLEDAR